MEGRGVVAVTAEAADLDLVGGGDRLGVLAGRLARLLDLDGGLLGARLGARQPEHRERDLVDQALDDLVGVARATLAALLHAPADQLEHALGDAVVGGQQLDQRHGLLVHVLVEHGGVVVGLERHDAGEHEVEQDADRVDVDALVDLLAEDLLRRQAGRGPEHVLLGDVRRSGDQLGEAEVEDLDVVGPPLPLAQHDVGGLDVAMDDAARVGLAEALEHLRGDRHEVGEREASPATHEAIEGLARDVLHHDEGATVIATEVVDRDDVGVLEAAEAAGLAFEAGQRLGVAHPVGGQDLEHDLTVQVDLRGLIDDPHPAAAKPPLDQVASRKGRPQQGVCLRVIIRVAHGRRSWG